MAIASAGNMSVPAQIYIGHQGHMNSSTEVPYANPVQYERCMGAVMRLCYGDFGQREWVAPYGRPPKELQGMFSGQLYFETPAWGRARKLDNVRDTVVGSLEFAYSTMRVSKYCSFAAGVETFPEEDSEKQRAKLSDHVKEIPMILRETENDSLYGFFFENPLTGLDKKPLFGWHGTLRTPNANVTRNILNGISPSPESIQRFIDYGASFMGHNNRRCPTKMRLMMVPEGEGAKWRSAFRQYNDIEYGEKVNAPRIIEATNFCKEGDVYVFYDGHLKNIIFDPKYLGKTITTNPTDVHVKKRVTTVISRFRQFAIDSRYAVWGRGSN